MMHRNSISLRWVAYEELVENKDSESDDDEVKANDISESTKTDVKKTDDDESAENTEDDVSESAEFEDEGTMKRQINKSEKLSKYFPIFFHEHWRSLQKGMEKKKKKKNFSRLMSQALRMKSTFGM